MEKITVDLPDDLSEELDQAVASGEFPSRDAAIETALKLLFAAPISDPYPLEEMRRLVKEGLDSGFGEPWSKDDFKREARRRFFEKHGRMPES